MFKEKLNNWRKYLFYSFLIILSIVLMFNFKHKKSLINFYDNNKNKIFSFIKNLKPIYASTNISNEDLLNFAFYKTLPLNKKQEKVLFVDYSNSKDVIEIKSLPIVKTENLNAYLKFISSNEKDKNKIDSVLSYYKNNIYQFIFSDGVNYAINPNIILLREDLIADLLKVSQEINFNKTKELFALKDVHSLPKKDFDKLSNKNMNFILVTNDTIFETKLSFDKKNLENQIIDIQRQAKNIEGELNKPIVKLKINYDRSIKERNIIDYEKDSSRIKISIEQFNKSINDSIRNVIDKNIQRKIHLFEKNNILKNLRYRPTIIFNNPNEITKEALVSVRELKIPDIVNKTLKTDSRLLMNRSLKNKKMKEEIKRANKELKIHNLDTIEIK